MAVQLKPCPFCGKKPELRETQLGHKGCGTFTATYTVKCDTCRYTISRESSFTLVDGQPKFEVNGHDLIVNLWNNRKE